LRKTPLSDITYRDCDAQELFMSSAKSRTIPPLRVSEELRADAESVLVPGETLSAFVMDAISRTIDFRKSQLDFLAGGVANEYSRSWPSNILGVSRAGCGDLAVRRGIRNWNDRVRGKLHRRGGGRQGVKLEQPMFIGEDGGSAAMRIPIRDAAHRLKSFI
jgi:hypothetical protein